MRILKQISLFITISVFITLNAQVTPEKVVLEHEQYDWQEQAILDTIYTDSTQNSAVYILDKKIIEYAIDEAGITQYNTIHHIIKINDDAAIESFNKVYIPIGYGSEIIDIKARTIKANGEVVNLTKESILSIEDLDDYGNFSQFALEGVEIGAQVEYLYTIKAPYGISYQFDWYSGHILRRSAKIHRLDFSLVSPEHLEFLYKTYNFEHGITDTTIEGKHYISIHLDTVPRYEKEDYSNYLANRYRIEYKYARNIGKGGKEFQNYTEAASTFYDIYMKTDKNGLKLAKKWLKKHPVNTTNEEEKIKQAEYLIKTNFRILDQASLSYQPTLESAFSNGVATEKAILKVYAAIYELLEIPYYFGFTTDKTNKLFDAEFESWNFFSKVVYYYPSIDMYSAPSEQLYRTGMIPGDWEGQKGLFIKPISMGEEFETGMKTIRDIPISDYRKNFVNMDLKVSFEDDFENVVVDYTNSLGGTFGVGIHSIYPYYNAEEKKETREEIIKGIHEDCEILSTSIMDYDSSKSSNENPFIVKSKVKLNSLIENAGPNYLFNIGLIIGPQVELYQEKERENDVYVHYPHTNDRTIEFEVPQGYTVEGLDKLNIHVYSSDSSMAFISQCEQKEDKVLVTINEYYQKAQLLKSSYNEFRRVINTAADFNKIVIVFKPI